LSIIQKEDEDLHPSIHPSIIQFCGLSIIWKEDEDLHPSIHQSTHPSISLPSEEEPEDREEVDTPSLVSALSTLCCEWSLRVFPLRRPPPPDLGSEGGGFGGKMFSTSAALGVRGAWGRD
jgi:hypothetical protein